MFSSILNPHSQNTEEIKLLLGELYERWKEVLFFLKASHVLNNFIETIINLLDWASSFD